MQMNFFKIVVFGLLICLPLGTSALAQEEVVDPDVNYSEFWIDVTLGKALNEKWKLGGDFGFRTALNNSNWTLLYIRPNINYQLLPILDLTFGLGYFNTNNSDFSNINEYRIYQDGVLHWPTLGPFKFQHRVRLEQRFFNFTDGDINNDFSFRGRYMIGARSDRFSLGGEKDWTGFISLEPFFPLGKDVNELLANNFRWDFALSYQVSEKLRIELHYILQTSEIFSSSDQRIKENIFRFRVFQKL